MSKKIDKDTLEVELCGLRDLIEEKFNRNKEDHDKIIEQTTKTNGSVRDLQKWKSFINGAVAVLTGIILPLFIYIMQKGLL